MEELIATCPIDIEPEQMAASYQSSFSIIMYKNIGYTDWFDGDRLSSMDKETEGVAMPIALREADLKPERVSGWETSGQIAVMPVPARD